LGQGPLGRGGLKAIGAREGFYYYFLPLLLPLKQAKAKDNKIKNKGNLCPLLPLCFYSYY
jgi:hypothetical protein